MTKLLKPLQWLYCIYAFLTFVIIMIPIFLLALIASLFGPRRGGNLIYGLCSLWADIWFFLIGIFHRNIYEAPHHKRKQYVFIANHTSYLDAPVLVKTIRQPLRALGKIEMRKVPLFGFMYSKLHITVDRSKLKSKYNSLKRSLEAIDQGKSLVIYPEGAIVTEREPVMGRFKDGAFRVSIEKQIPIVPVTIVYNWIILPADDFVLHWHPLKVVFHEPIEPNGITMNEIDQLKEKTRLVIEDELKKYVPHGNPSRVTE